MHILSVQNLLDQLDKNVFNEDGISLIEENASKFIKKSDLFFFFDTETTGLPADYNAPISDTDNCLILYKLLGL